MVWIAAIFIGLSLGLLGSGGSILTVPALIYLVGQDEKIAIAGSLAIVGVIAASSVISYHFKRQIKWSVVIRFGLPSMLASYLAASLSVYLTGIMQLTLFAIVMLLSAFFMIRQPKIKTSTYHGINGNNKAFNKDQHQQIKFIISGLIVGSITGLVGVGGGFLIVPSLVLLTGLAMNNAVATSLAIITLQSFTGFIKYHQLLNEQNISIDWQVIVTFSLIGIIGSLVGQKIAGKVPQHHLKRGFGIFLLIMGCFILYRSLTNLG